jgi:hypothetical protein
MEGEAPFHPIGCPWCSSSGEPLPPEDAKVQDALGSVVGGLDAVLCQKNPERVHLAQQAAGKPPRPICMVMLLINQLTQPCIPRPSFSTRWSGLWPYGQAVGTPPAPRRHTPRGQADPVVPSSGS